MMDVVGSNQLCLSVCLILAGTLVCSAEVACPEKSPCSCKVETHQDGNSLNIKCRKADTPGGIPDFSPLKGLAIAKLDLSVNNIKEIPDDAFSELEFESSDRKTEPELILSDNPLGSIARYAFRGIKFKKLSLYMNGCNHGKIPLIPLRELRGVTGLHMKLNNIDNIPDQAFTEFTNLQSLTLSDNLLGDVQDTAFAGLEASLKVVDLSRTGMTTFPTNALKNLKVLSHLSLNENPLKVIPNKLFADFLSEDNSFELSISGTGDHVLEIPEDAFSKESAKVQIHQLFLINNKLETIDFLSTPCESVFKPGKTNVYLQQNNIICDCNLLNIAKTGFYNLEGDCGSPEAYKDLRFKIKSDGYKEGKMSYLSDYGPKAQQDCANTTAAAIDLTCMTQRTFEVVASGCVTVHQTNLVLAVIIYIKQYFQ